MSNAQTEPKLGGEKNRVYLRSAKTERHVGDWLYSARETGSVATRFLAFFPCTVNV